MDNLKIILLVFLGSVVVVVLMAVGLSKMSGGEVETVKTVDQAELLAGARFVKGDENAKVTVVEFSDMQCPACKAAQPFAQEVEKLPNVRFVLRHFPLIQIHQNAWKGARAAEAGRISGKGFEMVEKLFEKQEEWSEESDPEAKFVGYAKELGLDEKAFRDKYRSEETDKLVAEDNSLANKLNLQGTPTFFVNGEQVAADVLVAKVKELLNK